MVSGQVERLFAADYVFYYVMDYQALSSTQAYAAPSKESNKEVAPLRVVYATEHDPYDINAWSGLVVFMREALISAGVQTHVVGNLKEEAKVFTKIKKGYYKYVRGQNYLRDREPAMQKGYARQLERALEGVEADAVVVPGSTLLAYLNLPHPLVFWSGSTFAGMKDFNEGFSCLSRETLKRGHEMEQAALSKCALAMYGSDWAAQSAIEHYDVDPAKVKVVPYGPNLRHSNTAVAIKANIEAKTFETCKLLFIGRYWSSKGGDTVLEVAQTLTEQGVPTELHIVGCIPPCSVPDYVTIHGWVKKETQEGLALLDKLYKEAHFFVLPTQAEAFGVVFAEASSYGLPSLAPRIGGITTAIKEGRNGYLVNPEEGAEPYVARIIELFHTPEAYCELAMCSFNDYQTRLNWTVAGERAKALIQEFCQ